MLPAYFPMGQEDYVKQDGMGMNMDNMSTIVSPQPSFQMQMPAEWSNFGFSDASLPHTPSFGHCNPLDTSMGLLRAVSATPSLMTDRGSKSPSPVTPGLSNSVNPTPMHSPAPTFLGLGSATYGVVDEDALFFSTPTEFSPASEWLDQEAKTNEGPFSEVNWKDSLAEHLESRLSGLDFSGSRFAESVKSSLADGTGFVNPRDLFKSPAVVADSDQTSADFGFSSPQTPFLATIEPDNSFDECFTNPASVVISPPCTSDAHGQKRRRTDTYSKACSEILSFEDSESIYSSYIDEDPEPAVYASHPEESAAYAPAAAAIGQNATQGQVQMAQDAQASGTRPNDTTTPTGTPPAHESSDNKEGKTKAGQSSTPKKSSAPGPKARRGRKDTGHNDPSYTYGCPYEGCDCKFKRAEHMNRHVKSIHEGVKPHGCDLCGKTFARRDNMKQHRRTHEKDSTMPSTPTLPLSEHVERQAPGVAGVNLYNFAASVHTPSLSPSRSRSNSVDDTNTPSPTQLKARKRKREE